MQHAWAEWAAEGAVRSRSYRHWVDEKKMQSIASSCRAFWGQTEAGGDL
jgi:hypothetical protein